MSYFTLFRSIIERLGLKFEIRCLFMFILCTEERKFTYNLKPSDFSASPGEELWCGPRGTHHHIKTHRRLDTKEELTRSSYYTEGKQALHLRTVQEDSKSHNAADLSWRTSVLFDEQQSAMWMWRITHETDKFDF